MSSRRKRSTANARPAPSIIPYYPAFYPQYGYNPAPYYNPMYDTPGYSYDPSNFIYYPVDQFGQVIGPPTTFPPISNNPYYEPYPHDDNRSPTPSHRSPRHSPRKPQLSHRESYHSPPPPPAPIPPTVPTPQYHSSVRRVRERSKHESLPPIHRHLNHPFTYTRPISPNDDELRFAVRDLTERGSALSILPHNNAINSIKYYDKLQKSYS
jgi:hypothetical protein